VLALEPDLYLLGPAGAYLTGRLSPPGAAALLLAALAAWGVLPVGASIYRFSAPLRRGRSHEAKHIHASAGDECTRCRDRVHV
jgi:hypothetical protein